MSNTEYTIVFEGNEIFGAGYTENAAFREANEWYEGESVFDLESVECSKELVDAVKKYGRKNVEFYIVDGVAVLFKGSICGRQDHPLTFGEVKTLYQYFEHNYLTVEKFAEHIGVSESEGQAIVDLGRGLAVPRRKAANPAFEALRLLTMNDPRPFDAYERLYSKDAY